jgi:nicotinate dehydrogenase subunit B
VELRGLEPDPQRPPRR